MLTDPDARDSQWRLAASLWLIAGFAFPFLTPATNMLSKDLQQHVSVTQGMADELAYRVAFTIVRVPLTGLLGVAIAALQCVLVSGVRPLARRWLMAAAIGACVSTLIWLPTTLVAAQLVGDTSQGVIRPVLLAFGAALLAGLVTFAQRRTTRRAVMVPSLSLRIGVLSAVLGALGGSALG